EWFNKLLESLSDLTLMILDNASYHSRISNRQPTSTWKRREIVDWLNQ
ncbi:unnamed protein product, partial [Tenebrio molitor]